MLALAFLLSHLVQDTTSNWNGFQKVSFEVDGRPCFLTQPAIPAPGRPWVWRTSFPDFHAEVDAELLKHGYTIGYVECLDMLGSDGALDIMDRFYDTVTTQRGLSKRPALEAVSRGGLHAYRYAARHPNRVACIYADTPVMNLASWPLGARSEKETADAMHYYGFKDEAALRAYRGNPIDILPAIARAKIPIRHVVSLNDTLVPPSQNTFVAAQRLKALGDPMEIVTVKEGTAESHGHHFDLPEVFQSARFIMRHTPELPNGHEYFSLRSGLQNSRWRFQTLKNGRVVFLGGSITYNPGWRDSVMTYLKQRFPDTQFEFQAAGIPSLGSVPHAFRLDHDVLSQGSVDLMFVEAAVNDHNYDGQPKAAELALRGMEGVVRHMRKMEPYADVIELHFVHDEHLKTWTNGQIPYTVAAHERVAAHYGIPSVNLSREVFDRIGAGQLTWDGDFKDIHPSPYGQQLYANSITRLLDAAYSAPFDPNKYGPYPSPGPLDPDSYFQGRYGDVTEARGLNGFSIDPKWRPTDGKETRIGFVDVPALVSTTPGSAFRFWFEGTAAGLMITSGPDAGTIAVSIDSGPEKTIDTRTPWSPSLHLPWALMIGDDLKPGPHTVRVRLVSGALRVFHLLEN